MKKMKIVSTVALLGLVVVIVLYASGRFGPPRVAPARGPEAPGEPAPSRSAPVASAAEDVFEEAVGTVRPRRSVVLAAQVAARVTEVGAQVGQPVTSGTVVIRLDDRELVASASGARDALAAATAARGQAEQAKAQGDARLTLSRSRYDRAKSFFDRGAATTEQVEAAQAELATASAGVADAVAAIAAADARIAQSKQVVAGAEVALGHTVIAVPLDGVVAERMVEPGDLAWPGRPLLVILDPNQLRLEAQVREGLMPSVLPGADVEVEVPGAAKTMKGTVAEVVPAADPRSRTFEVRINLPADPTVRPGMFGRVRFRVGRRDVVRAPGGAVRRVGQLETVSVREGDRWLRRLVTTGETTADGRVEILSGLRGGEVVAVPEAVR